MEKLKLKGSIASFKGLHLARVGIFVANWSQKTLFFKLQDKISAMIVSDNRSDHMETIKTEQLNDRIDDYSGFL